MNVTLTRRAIRAIPRTAHATRAQTNSLRRGWIRAVALLGDKHILARQIARKHADAAAWLVSAWGALSVSTGDALAATGVIDLDAWLWVALGWAVVFAAGICLLVVCGDRWLGDEGDHE